MKLTLKPQQNMPLYEQIVALYIQNIQSGLWPPGTKLPTVRHLAAENKLAHGTVKHAYDVLEQQGYIEKTQGRGTFVAFAHKGAAQSKSSLAKQAMDDFFAQMAQLHFAPEEIRTLLDWKLAELDHTPRLLQVGLVVECPEMAQALEPVLQKVQKEFVLAEELRRENTRLSPQLDALLLPQDSQKALAEKIPPDIPVYPLALSVLLPALLQLARIPAGQDVAVLAYSPSCAQLLESLCLDCGLSPAHLQRFVFAELDDASPLWEEDCKLVLPACFAAFAPEALVARIREKHRQHPAVLVDWQIQPDLCAFLETSLAALHTAKFPTS